MIHEIWQSFLNLADVAFSFVLQGNAPQEIIPLALIGLIVLVAYLFYRMSKGDTA